MVDEPKRLTLDSYQVATIRRALLLGLSSLGEVQRVRDHFEASIALGQSIDEKFRPVHPTGSPETVGEFADALLYLE